ELIKLKKLHPAFAEGVYKEIPNNNSKVFSFTRTHELETVLVMINLSDQPQRVTLMNPEYTPEDKQVKMPRLNAVKLLSGTPNASVQRGGTSITLRAYNIQIWRVY